MAKVIKDTDRWCPFGYDNGVAGGVANRNHDGTSMYECLGDACMAYINGDDDNRGGTCKLMEKQMGKNPTDAKTKALRQETAKKAPKRVLHVEQYIKKNGAMGLRKYYKFEVV